MLTMMDANGSTGGVSPSLFNVTSMYSLSTSLSLSTEWAPQGGSDTSCLPSPPSSSTPHITPNITDTLQTCEPWGLTITNGTMPYNITLAALDSPFLTIVNMGPGNDVFTYIDRADPNGLLIGECARARMDCAVR